jgi:hypothetical protein
MSQPHFQFVPYLGSDLSNDPTLIALFVRESSPAAACRQPA